MAKVETQNNEITFTPPHKRIQLRPVVKRESFMGKKDHDGVFMFTGCSQSFVLPVSSLTGRLVDPLDDNERKYLEQELKVDLNVNHSDCFYKTHRVTIKKTDSDINNLYREFDLDNPADYLDYKILLKCPNVASTWAQRDDNPQYEWAMKELNEEFTERVSNAEYKSKAYNWYYTVSKDKSKMLDYLRVYGLGISPLAGIDELQSALYEIIESPKKLHKLLDIINDVDFAHKVFIDKAIRIGEIKIIGINKYALVSGDVIGNSQAEVVAWVKDKANNMLVSSIKDKIQANKI